MHPLRKEILQYLQETATSISEADPSALFHAYKVEDHPATYDEYKECVEDKAHLLDRLLELSAPQILLHAEASKLITFFPPSDDSRKYESVIEKMTAMIKEIDEGASWEVERADVIAQETIDAVSDVIEEANASLSDEDTMRRAYSWYRHPKRMHERILRHAQRSLRMPDISEDNPLENYGQDVLEEDLNYKRYILEEFTYKVTDMRKIAIGCEQIAAGGTVLNQKEHRYSVAQNHARFPNLDYTEQQRATFRDYGKSLQELLQKIPDISDIVLPRRIRQRKDVDFSVEELVKDPMDITFGNDAGCCIAVSTNREDLINGWTVPHYQLDPHIRLFGIYRSMGQKRTRVGLIPAFETAFQRAFSGNVPREKTILSCNSIELSSVGIPGGTETKTELTRYAEQWIQTYAQTYGYYGATMGHHSYNAAVRFSQHTENMVREPLAFIGRIQGFHSDIFQRTPDARQNYIYRTKPHSCYWITKGRKSG